MTMVPARTARAADRETRGEVGGDGVGLGDRDGAVVDDVLRFCSSALIRSVARASRSASEAGTSGASAGTSVVSSFPESSVTTTSVVGVVACEAALLNEGIATSSPIAPPPSRPAVTPIAAVRRLRRRSGVSGASALPGAAGGFIVGPFELDHRSWITMSDVVENTDGAS
jgi:hypothetical protein